MVMFARHCNYRAAVLYQAFELGAPCTRFPGPGVCTQVRIRLLCQGWYTSVVDVGRRIFLLSEPTTACNQNKGKRRYESNPTVKLNSKNKVSQVNLRSCYFSAEERVHVCPTKVDRWSFYYPQITPLSLPTPTPNFRLSLHFTSHRL